MQLAHKNVLMLVADGVEYEECVAVRSGFEREGANVFCSASSPYTSVETARNGQRGPNIDLDLPFDVLPYEQFDAMIIPDGYLAAIDISDNPAVLALVRNFYIQGIPLFASGDAVEVLYRSGIISKHVVVREDAPIENFINQAINKLTTTPSYNRPRNTASLLTS